ncbi:MAG: pirin family protein [Woeseia sp.]|nr:pirin family protein [Woeseia sp.]MBT8097798.1 pirin family protein [Woeseia sp.]NNE59688.1 pirin family protein [Woeseia sp.]NNL56042.1 pirin family protein [Woeseia sp.]
MSHVSATEPRCTSKSGIIALTIEARVRDLDGSPVRRVLPSASRRMVGPFIFFDHFGPTIYAPGTGLAVRPHPHIGLATVSYLFEGEIMHRDSLGIVQPIRPGAVNLMTAGRGIVHSERTATDLDGPLRLHGLQLWLALPDEQESCSPAFEHIDASRLPVFKRDGVSGKLIIGEAYQMRSPVEVFSKTLFMECAMANGSQLTLPDDCAELAIYVVDGELRIADEIIGGGTMAVACPDHPITVEANKHSRIAIVGGDPVGKRHIWWNFVATTKERIEKAKTDWQQQRFEKVPGDNEFTPLPER